MAADWSSCSSVSCDFCFYPLTHFSWWPWIHAFSIIVLCLTAAAVWMVCSVSPVYIQDGFLQTAISKMTSIQPADFDSKMSAGTTTPVSSKVSEHVSAYPLSCRNSILQIPRPCFPTLKRSSGSVASVMMRQSFGTEWYFSMLKAPSSWHWLYIWSFYLDFLCKHKLLVDVTGWILLLPGFSGSLPCDSSGSASFSLSLGSSSCPYLSLLHKCLRITQPMFDSSMTMALGRPFHSFGPNMNKLFW